jgi:hypothetical protein
LPFLTAFLLSLFFLLFLLFFWPTVPGNRDGGDREAVARRVCARGGRWMSSADETSVTRKDGTKGRKHK